MILIFKISYTIKKDDENTTLKNILSTKLNISKILIYNLIKHKKILVNGEYVYSKSKLKENDNVTVIMDNDTDINSSEKMFKDKFRKFDFPVDVLYEDDYILAVNKPAFMPSHPCASNYETTLSNAVHNYLDKQNINTIHLINRLDKNTSGISIFAKHKYIQELFIKNKDKIEFQKFYIAIVNGLNIDNEGIITDNIKRTPNSIITREICDNFEGETALTKYKKVKENIDKNYTVIEVELLTGRTHQIRVHFSSYNHTLLGDDLYAKEYEKSTICNLIKRQALHARKVIFIHPITNKKIELIADIPEDMKKLIDF